jgi:error-prone DNA polymerase
MIEESESSNLKRHHQSPEPRAPNPQANAYFCNTCSHDWAVVAVHASALKPVGVHRSPRFRSLDDLIARTGLRRDEVVTLADIGALNSFGYDRRSALWQAERAVRPSGELFDTAREAGGAGWESLAANPSTSNHQPPTSNLDRLPSTLYPPPSEECPLRPMTESERLVADYAGTGLTVGRHPMALRRDELAMRGVLRAIDLHAGRNGRRVRVAGMVITRQRPGTAKGFVFLTLEDETGIANVIVRPDLFARDRLVIVDERFLLVDGVLQHQDGVVSVRAEAVQGMTNTAIEFNSHDFYSELKTSL